MTPEAAQDFALLRTMLLAREFEAALMRRADHGFQLLSSGQEAVAAGLCAVLDARDRLLTSGRSIAPALARGIPARAVMAELLGKVDGPNRGRAGRGHIAQPDVGFFGAHAVVGGNLTIAAGVALARTMQREAGIVVCLFGDGACGAGALHETLNMAALWKLPLLLVCDNNGYSVSTTTARAVAPARLADLAAPFGIRAMDVDGMDVHAVRDAAAALAQHVREGAGPAFLECRSQRFQPHSSASRETRTAQELAQAVHRCPIEGLARRMQAAGHADEAAIANTRREAGEEVAAALSFADASPYPPAEEALRDVHR